MAKKKELDTVEKPNSLATTDAQPTSVASKSDDLPMTQTDALAMLSSALNHCRMAGVDWRHRQQDQHLLLAIPNAHIAITGTGELGIVPVMATGN